MNFKVFDLLYKYESNQVIRLEQQSETTNLREKVLKPLNRRNQRVWSFRNNQIKKTHQISERMIKNEYGIVVIQE